MSNSYYESPQTDKRSNMVSWAIASGIGVAVLGLAAAQPQSAKSKLTEVFADTPVVREACSSGHARSYTSRETTMNGARVLVRCDKYWPTQGQRMP